MVRDCCFITVMEHLCGEWWEQSLKERGKKRVRRFPGWLVKNSFQCCQTEKASSVKELLSASFSFIYCPDFFSKQKKHIFSPEIFFLFHSWRKCVFIIFFFNSSYFLWFFYFFSLLQFNLIFFLVWEQVERNSQKKKMFSFSWFEFLMWP